MRAQLRAAGAFLKAIRWHLLLFPVYVFAAIWMSSLPVLAACELSGIGWQASWSWGILLAIAPDMWFAHEFQAWIGGLCAGLTVLGAVVVRLLPIRRLWLRRALAICLMIFPAATGLQWLNIFVLNGMTPRAALWAPVLLTFPVGLWLATGELARGVEALAAWRARVIPTLMVCVVMLLGVEVSNRSSHLWRLGRVAWVRASKGPFAAEQLAFEYRMMSAGGREAYRRACQEHCRRLSLLIESRPADPEVPAARLRLAETAWNNLQDPGLAGEALSALRPEACTPELWAESRLFAVDMLLMANPPVPESRLREIESVRTEALGDRMLAQRVIRARLEALRELGRMDEARAQAHRLIAGMDRVPRSRGRSAEDLARSKAALLVSVGLVDEARKGLVADLEAAGSPRAEERAGRIVAGMAFAASPVGKPAPPLVGTDLKGGRFDLAALRGRTAVVIFGYDCIGPAAANWLEAWSWLRGDGVEFVTVWLESDETYLKERATPVPWPVLFDAKAGHPDVREAWGVRWGVRWGGSFVVDSAGKVAASGLKAPGLAAQVREALAGHGAKPVE